MAGIRRDIPGLQLLYDHAGGDAELRHPVAVRLDVDHLRLDAEEVDLGHVLHQQQLTAQKLGDLVQLRLRVALPVQGEEHPVHVAEIVVDDGRACARRQAALRVSHLPPQLVPHLGQGRLVVAVLDGGRHDRQAAKRHRLDLVELLQLLDRDLDLVAHLFLDLDGRRAGIRRCDHRVLDREVGVFQAAHGPVRLHASDDQECGENQRRGPVVEAELGDVHCASRSAMRLTSMPSRRCWTAEAAITSPSSRPATISTSSP